MSPATFLFLYILFNRKYLLTKYDHFYKIISIVLDCKYNMTYYVKFQCVTSSMVIFDNKICIYDKIYGSMQGNGADENQGWGLEEAEPP